MVLTTVILVSYNVLIIGEACPLSPSKKIIGQFRYLTFYLHAKIFCPGFFKLIGIQVGIPIHESHLFGKNRHFPYSESSSHPKQKCLSSYVNLILHRSQRFSSLLHIDHIPSFENLFLRILQLLSLL